MKVNSEESMRSSQQSRRAAMAIDVISGDIIGVLGPRYGSALMLRLVSAGFSSSCCSRARSLQARKSLTISFLPAHPEISDRQPLQVCPL